MPQRHEAMGLISGMAVVLARCLRQEPLRQSVIEV